MKLKNAAVIVAAVFLVPVGCITMISPIPGGSLVLPAALAALCYASPRFRRCIQVARSKMLRVNKLMIWVEARVGQRIGGALKLTRPSGMSDNAES